MQEFFYFTAKNAHFSKKYHEHFSFKKITNMHILRGALYLLDERDDCKISSALIVDVILPRKYAPCTRLVSVCVYAWSGKAERCGRVGGIEGVVTGSVSPPRPVGVLMVGAVSCPRTKSACLTSSAYSW